jgi:hypothetical protein
MVGNLEPRIVDSVEELAKALRNGRGRDGNLGDAIILIGAGCSISAGVPGAADIAKRMAREIAEREECCTGDADDLICYRALVEGGHLRICLFGDPAAEPNHENIDWYSVYDQMFERHYQTPNAVRKLFYRVISDAKGAINWAHLCIGELVQRKYVSTVLTTNFDGLALSGLVRAGVLPVVCDGIESLNRIVAFPRDPQLVELHGSRHTYSLLNTPEEVYFYRSRLRRSRAGNNGPIRSAGGAVSKSKSVLD